MVDAAMPSMQGILLDSRALSAVRFHLFCRNWLERQRARPDAPDVDAAAIATKARREAFLSQSSGTALGGVRWLDEH